MKSIFYTTISKNGIIGIQYQDSISKLVALACSSPNASPRSKAWLEKQLKRVYGTYYAKVSKETLGQFWSGDEPGILLK